MARRLTRIFAVAGLLLPLLGAGCGPKVKTTTTLPAEQVLPLQTATLEELIGKLKTLGAGVRTINAVTELEPSTGSAYSGVIEEYHDVRAFVLAERREEGGGEEREVRLLGQAPVVRKNIFDMVADDARFKIFIPSKNKFIEGPTTLTQQSEKPIENLRPQHLFDALFLTPPRAAATHLLEENEFGGIRYYGVSEIVKGEGGTPQLARKWWFDRRGLELVRVQDFDAAGRLLSDIHYSNWLADKAAPYPGKITVVRPHDDYQITLTIRELTLNEPLPATAFVLEKPPGVEVVELGEEKPKSEKEPEQP